MLWFSPGVVWYSLHIVFEHINIKTQKISILSHSASRRRNRGTYLTSFCVDSRSKKSLHLCLGKGATPLSPLAIFLKSAINFTRSVRQLRMSQKVCLCLFPIIFNISWSSCKIIPKCTRSPESLCLSSQSKRSHLVSVIDRLKYANVMQIGHWCQKLYVRGLPSAAASSHGK